MLTLAEFKQELGRTQEVDWCYKPTVESLWSFSVSASRAETWAYLSDTSRFNRELGFSPREEREENGQMIIATRMLGFRQQWVEEPWTWVEGRTMTSRRVYRRGMAKHVHAVFHIEEEANGCRVYIYFGWTPTNAAWAAFLRFTESIIEKKFARNFASFNQRLQRPQRSLFALQKPEVSPATLVRFKKMCEQLEQLIPEDDLVWRFYEHILDSDDADLEPLRLVPLAKKWGCDLEALLRLCLHATRLGVLNISWEVLCPHCRGSRFSANSLGEIPESGECGVCVVDFSTADANSIEVVFHVHPSVRAVAPQLFCAAEPAKKSHIKLQQVVRAGQTADLQMHLNDGIYRLRQVGNLNQVRLEVRASHSLSPAVELSRVAHDMVSGAQTHFHFKNDSEKNAVFVLEELWWEARALLPAQVLALPDFRDLFAEEHLSSNVKLFLGEQTILFTDIVGSTRFYTEVGDAKAFSEVREHFTEVFREVQLQHGVVVKTIGDAVMASFPSSERALRAAIEIQKRFPISRQDTSIRLRISLHTGPVIAVHLNTGVDYFGTTVNFAAKMQAYVNACEIAFSDQVLSQPTRGSVFGVPVQVRPGQENVGYASIYVLSIKDSAAAA